jgi:hypothetical protein
MAPSVGSRFTRGRFNDAIVLMKIKTATGFSEITVAVYVYLIKERSVNRRTPRRHNESTTDSGGFANSNACDEIVLVHSGALLSKIMLS